MTNVVTATKGGPKYLRPLDKRRSSFGLPAIGTLTNLMALSGRRGGGSQPPAKPAILEVAWIVPVANGRWLAPIPTGRAP